MKEAGNKEVDRYKVESGLRETAMDETLKGMGWQSEVGRGVGGDGWEGV